MKNFRALAFFDLDGTLYDLPGTASEEVVQAIQTIQKNGILPILATGRSLFETREIMERTNIQHIIGLNGMIGKAGNEIIFSEEIPSRETVRLFDFALKRYKHHLAYHQGETLWISSKDDPMAKHYSYLAGAEPIIPVDVLMKKNMNMLLVGSDQPEYDNTYRLHFPQLDFFRNSPYNMDVTKKGINKGTGILEMSDYFGNQLPIFVFGDGTNDVAMFEKSFYSIAMGNAISELKEKAEFVTKNNDDAGIIHAFKYLGWL